MNKYIEYRREFHHYPEIGWTEIRTSARVAELLEKIHSSQFSSVSDNFNLISEERYSSFSFWHSQRVMSSISLFSLCLLLLQFSVRSNSSSTGFHCSITTFSCSVSLSCSIKSRYVSIINTSHKNIFDL